MQKYYELLVVLDYEISDEEIENKTEKIKGILAREGGEVKNVNKWGKRRLTYEINKSRKGYYLLVYFLCEPNKIKNLEHDLKYIDGINRFMTTVVSNVEAISFTGADLEATEEAV